MKWRDYIPDLQRCHMIKTGLAYLVIAWLVIEVLSILFPAFQAFPKALKTAIIILGIGFPIWLVNAWIYDFSSERIKNTELIIDDVEASRNIILSNKWYMPPEATS